MKKISLDPEAIAALNAESPNSIQSSKPLSNEMIQIIRQRVALAMFGLTMKPTFKQQLLTFSSFAAIKASWAADHFQRQYHKHTRNI